MNFLCTIITPSYRRVNFLKKQYKELNRYLKHFNCEWMVCLEKKDTQSIHYIKSLKNKNINLIVGNFGNSAKAFTNSFRVARGKFLNFSGDDDVRTKSFFTSLNKNKHYPIIIGQGSYVNLNNTSVRKISIFFKKIFLYFYSHKLLRVINFLMSPAVIFSKEIAIKNRGLDNKNYPWTNDYEFNLRILKNNKCKVLNKLFVKCYFSSSTITGKYNFKKILELIKINKNYNNNSILFLINILFLVPLIVRNLFKFR